ncbi:MAG: hypothetical protein K2X66_02740, partial [Cyanobacteria bacterium]|nr:hypothetical protein [Cyanobacteriota bacterium]
KMAEKIRPGDSLIFYLTGKMLLGGIVTIQSEMVEDFSPVWACHSNPKKEERFPYRFQTKPYLIPADSEGMLSVKSFHSQLNYLKKWPENNWTLGFQSTLHQWPEEDFRLVETMFKESCAVKP